MVCCFREVVGLAVCFKGEVWGGGLGVEKSCERSLRIQRSTESEKLSTIINNISIEKYRIKKVNKKKQHSFNWKIEDESKKWSKYLNQVNERQIKGGISKNVGKMYNDYVNIIQVGRNISGSLLI